MNPKLIKYGAMALGVIVVLFVVWWFLTEPGRQKRNAAEARTGQVAAEGQSAATRDAVGVVIEGQKRDGAYDEATRKAVDDLLNTPEDQRDAAAIVGLCLSDAYRNSPSCVQLRRAGSR